MNFTTPWQSSWYLLTIDLARRLLRLFSGLENRFIAWVTHRQNRRVLHHLRAVRPRDLLLIMPRCVKKPGCSANVKDSLSQCLDCNDCPLGDVTRLCQRYQIEALVAFRSHIAFDMARTRRPDLIIATACHDRLIKALRSVPEIPALLAPLPPMGKMCVGATVDLVWLEQQLHLVTGIQKSPVPALKKPAVSTESP